MRISVIRYLIKEGIRSMFKNKKSTFASIGTMCATMLIFGLFFLIGENLNTIMTQIQEKQGIRVFLYDITQEQTDIVEQELAKINGVNPNTIDYISKEEALESQKQKWGKKGELLNSYEDVFPASFVVTLTDLSLNEGVQKQIKDIENVKDIASGDETIEKLISVANGIRIGTGVISALLVIVSIFIISNTIKLTVHARRKEISIMKYVGATNDFIRGPFVVEGIIIGILSGAVTILIVGALYNVIINNLIQSSFTTILGGVKLLSFADVFNSIVIVYIILGIGIGVLGSRLSMKKYLDV